MPKRRSRPLSRRVEAKPERRIVKVFTEGRGSEPDYIRGLADTRLDNASLKVVISDQHGVPWTLVDLARRCRNDEDVDDVWVVFDVECPDPHPRLKECMRTAKDAGIRVAVSNPCFEYWLVLHFRDSDRALTTTQMESLSRSLDGRPKKRIDFQKYASSIDVACRRAKRREASHETAGTCFPHDNPSTSMHRLVLSLIAVSSEA